MTKTNPMPTTIFTVTILISLVFSQSTLADVSNSSAYAFNPSDLMDPQLNVRMVDLATNADRGERALELIIEEIEQTDGKFEPRLYAYLSELGQIKQANQQHVDAIDIFKRMQSLTHWADGVYSPLQMESLRLQSRSHATLGKLRDADKIERFHFRVAEQNLENETDLISPLWRLSDWQRSSLQYREALENYEKALTIIEKHDMHVAFQARTLFAKALTEHLAKKCCADVTLRTAMSLSKQSHEIDDQQTRDAILDAADMSVIHERPDAMTLYRHLGNAPVAFLGPRSKDQISLILDRTKNPASHLASRKVIHYQQQPTISLGKTRQVTSQFSTGDPVRLCASEVQRKVRKEMNGDSFVDVSIDVSPNGKASKVEISGTAPNRLKRYLKTTLVKSAYRPAIENGEPQAATLTFRQYFNRAKPLKSSAVADWRGILTEHACQLVSMR
ncbi:MAG: tetratricopeptide (TPR) repeat protein [Candidatus Azotimanducaceae bacterium]|jgi:tetratricopeptide (TPR) repeat protein